MSNKQRRGGLGRGLGALIPSAPAESAAVAPDPGDGSTPAPAATVSPTASPAASPTVSPGEPGPTPAAPGAPPAGATAQPEQLSSVPGARFVELPVSKIRANASQPRQVFDEETLDELAHSIREFGVLQPVVVRPDGDEYELVMGERRLRASTAAGLDTIPAIVRDTADDAMLRDALLENIHRAQLNPLEEAAAYQQLLEEFDTTHEQLAHRIGRSRPQITNTIRLLNLPIAVQRRVAAGVLSAGHARALLSLDSHEAQDELAGRIVAEGLSVRATEELVSLAQHGGAAKKPTRPTPARRITAPAVEELAGRLSDAFDTRVRVDIGKRKGKITVEFATIDDLERIVGVMAPEIAARRRSDDQSGGG